MLHFFQLFIFGFISSFFIGRVLIQGWLGQGLKNKTEYILSNKFVFNTSFILFTIFYFLIVIQMHYSIISLDPSDKIAVSMDGVQVEVSGILEPAKLDLIISVLNKGLILHYCMLYLISTLFFVFTIKLIADRDLYTPYWQGKIQSLPLGNTINNLLIRLIKIWKVSNILWIYFMMGSLLIAICFSTFAVYASLAGLQG